MRFDPTTEQTFAWATSIRRQTSGLPESHAILLGTLAAESQATDDEHRVSDPTTRAMLESLTAPDRPVRAVLDAALAGRSLPEPVIAAADPLAEMPQIAAAAAAIARRTGAEAVGQRHVLAAALVAAELPDDLAQALGADRTDLASRLLNAVLKENPEDSADRAGQLPRVRATCAHA